MKYPNILQKKLLLIILVATLGIIIAAGLYVWQSTSQAHAEDKKRYDTLQRSFAAIHDQLQKDQPPKQQWNDENGQCANYGGDQYGAGKEWYCFITSKAWLSYRTDAETNSEIEAIVRTIKSNSEYDVPPKDNLIQTLTEKGKVSLAFMHKPSEAECKLTLSAPNVGSTEGAEATLQCGGGALKSWYKPVE